MLVRCLYASRRPKAQSTAGLRSILAESRKANARNGITGVLVATDNSFIQVLEGGRTQVCETYNQIILDKRHSNITLLAFGEIAHRSFESWSLGEVTVEHLNPAILLKHSATQHIDPFSMSGPAVLALLNDLVASGSVVCGKVA